VRVENEQRVLEAAGRLGYAVNLAAQTVARGHNGAVALLAKDIADGYFSPIAAGVLQAADDADLILTMGSTSGQGERTLRMLAGLRGHRPRAIIVAGSRTTDDRNTDRLVTALQQYETDGGRVVMISQPGLPFDTISVENVTAGRDLAIALHGLGYRKFAIFAGPGNVLTALDRTQGLIEALGELGTEVPVGNILICPMTRDGGYAAAGELLTRNAGVEIVIAVHDSMAVGALARFREASVSLPEDLAVAGFDDIPALRDVTPALTTVNIPWTQVGQLALQLALSERGPKRVAEMLRGHVILRQSTPALT
jgi:LacI family transcriptional regulator